MPDGDSPTKELTAPLRADALGDSEARFRVLVENSPDVIMTLDPEGTVLFTNYALPLLSVEQVIGTCVLDYVDEADREKYKDVFTEVLKTGEARSLELAPAGAKWWLTRLIPIKHESEVITVLVIATDISEQKRVEEALRDSENKFRALTETTTAAIFIFQRTRMLYANPAAELITGYTHDELLTMNFWEVVHPDYRDLVKSRGWARLRGDDVPSRWESPRL